MPSSLACNQGGVPGDMQNVLSECSSTGPLGSTSLSSLFHSESTRSCTTGHNMQKLGCSAAIFALCLLPHYCYMKLSVLSLYINFTSGWHLLLLTYQYKYFLEHVYY
ncbi:hypothetical protein XELAEV_18003044mg [Xenopus laevis]|nr:hypothetical protein XELAEV_18003044mg [Xenopus laevis]